MSTSSLSSDSTQATESTLPSRAELRILAAGTLMPGFQGMVMPNWIATALKAGLGSVCIYGTNLSSPAQLATLMGQLRAVSSSVLLTLDEEGGDVTRLHYLTGSNQPGNAVLGRIDDPATTASSAAAIADELNSLGFNLNLAPDADVNSTAANPVIGVRSFGADASHVATHTAAWTTGLQGAGVAACAKHFPGHGDTATDSHLALPTIEVDLQTLRERELVPFGAAIAANVASIMTSHIMVPVLDAENPATFSPAILGGLLRDSLGFEGAIITDALDMAGASAQTGIEIAAVRALAAGADLLCLGSETTPERYEGILEAIVASVHNGQLAPSRLREAAARTAKLTRDYPPRPAAGAGSTPDQARITAAFELSDAARAWLADAAQPVLVQLETEANMAVGQVPWGARALDAASELTNVGPAAKIALIGRGLDPAHQIWGLADSLRAQGHRVIVVECGWPRGGADLVTFGASRSVSRALVGLLAPHIGGLRA
ncbi:glycoside hydrolase [Arthrobacter sp. MYb227]|uniref:glycoside hydrolase family 3 N-terminal domain-containing protein n=1 Tax=Arthrobacter sp. MYb227 TaxID=1848601 RepID=UPI000CFA8B42|nr:glycoside hydrolase family 3 N-terminal domain-containing protein [Arthrobacter sp. MYb227]PQZ91143.1 glycoside hydrolase [Arthrobacter sp. MYb227]